MDEPTPFPMPSWPDPTLAPADAGREPLTAATVPPTAGAEALEAPPTTTAVVGAPTGYSGSTLPHTGAAEHHDESIVGLYADLHIAIERRWRHVLHQLIACRPHLCPLPGPCRCDRPCTSTLAEILEAHTTNRGTDVAMHIDRGWPTHPGPDALADLMDRWAVDIFGWEIIR